MSCLRIVLGKWFEIGFELNTLGLWFLKIELWNMLFYVFINVFQKMGPRGLVLMHLNLVLAWRCNLGFPDFALPLERGEVPLERGIRASSISLHCFTVRSSGGLGARAEACLKLERAASGDFTHPVLSQYARAGKFTLERVPLLHVRSSGETWARAGLCFSENFETVFRSHLCILIPF